LQSNPFAQVVNAFVSAASPVNIVGTFLTSGIVLARGEDGKLYCRISLERARCFLLALYFVSNSMPTQEEVEDIERNIHLQHIVELTFNENASDTE
jgi:hypothetical protein